MCAVDVPLQKYINEVLRAQRLDVLGNGLTLFSFTVCFLLHDVAMLAQYWES